MISGEYFKIRILFLFFAGLMLGSSAELLAADISIKYKGRDKSSVWIEVKGIGYYWANKWLTVNDNNQILEQNRLVAADVALITSYESLMSFCYQNASDIEKADFEAAKDGFSPHVKVTREVIDERDNISKAIVHSAVLVRVINADVYQKWEELGIEMMSVDKIPPEGFSPLGRKTLLDARKTVTVSLEDESSVEENSDQQTNS